MDLGVLDKLSCKILIRKYVLIAQPTRWSQQESRVVVHSPILNIGSSVSSVPVKCHHGSGQNDVDFLPKSDFEVDTQGIYEKSYVSRQPSYDYAHGVAAFDSAVSADSECKRGHRFWIFIGSDTANFKNTVPVVILDTYQNGIVYIDQARWFPNTKGPGVES